MSAHVDGRTGTTTLLLLVTCIACLVATAARSEWTLAAIAQGCPVRATASEYSSAPVGASRSVSSHPTLTTPALDTAMPLICLKRTPEQHVAYRAGSDVSV
jgi:hypothetical protein